jgi:hypothetical protein
VHQPAQGVGGTCGVHRAANLCLRAQGLRGTLLTPLPQSKGARGVLLPAFFGHASYSAAGVHVCTRCADGCLRATLGVSFAVPAADAI